MTVSVAVALSDTPLGLGKCAKEDSRTQTTGDLGFDSPSCYMARGEK